MDEKPQNADHEPSDAPDADGASTERERKLIEAALEGAQPASGWPQTSTAWFEGAPLPPHGAFPGYDIVREIHRGGQGVVYQAVQLSTRRRVALKVMHSGPFMGSSGRARFDREVQVLGQLDHPNIVSIHDSGVTQDGSCFYVMDYISGKPLDQLLNEGQLPIREALRLFAKICDAVNAAHLKGVIHRDLKPGNIRIDKHGEPIVVDFGLAKLAVPGFDDEEQGSGRLMSTTGQFIGSLPWASPEQADGSPSDIDVRTDVYSLGVILYQLLTNRFPYEVLGNMRDVLDNILKAEPARPSTIRRKINDEVETIVLKALSKERDRRYQSAGDLGRDVHRFLEGQPIEAKRDSGWYVITKTLRRYRGPVIAGAGALSALVVFAVVVSILYTDAKAARRVAEQQTVQAQEARAAETAQRKLAEARLESAYGLANTMLTDFYDAIRDLRGATTAKLALAENAVATLDELEGQAQSDPRRLLMIGRGRLRLGMLYAGRAELHRIGRLEEGQALYESALSIAQALIDQDEASVEGRHLKADALAALAHVQRLQQDYAGALESIDAATDTAEATLAQLPEEHDLLGTLESLRASSIIERGNILVEEGMAAKDASAQQRLADRARLAFLDAMDKFQSMIDRDVDPDRGQIGKAHALVRLAEWEIRSVAFDAQRAASIDRSSMLDRLAEAEAFAQRALPIYQDLQTRHPENGAYPRDRLIAVEAIANIYRLRSDQYEALAQQDAGRAEELRQLAVEARETSIAMLEDALRVGQRAFDADEANATLGRRLAMLQGRLGQSYEADGRLEEAKRMYAESVRQRETLAAVDPTPQHFNDAVVGWYRLGKLHEFLAENASERTAQLEAALDAFMQAKSYVQKQIDSGATPDNTHDQTIQDQIDAVRQRLSSG